MGRVKHDPQTYLVIIIYKNIIFLVARTAREMIL